MLSSITQRRVSKRAGKRSGQMGRPQAFVGFEVLRHADVAWGVDHFSISALPSTVGDIRESMRSSVAQHFLEFTDFIPYFHVFNMKVMEN